MQACRVNSPFFCFYVLQGHRSSNNDLILSMVDLASSEACLLSLAPLSELFLSQKIFWDAEIDAPAIFIQNTLQEFENALLESFSDN